MEWLFEQARNKMSESWLRLGMLHSAPIYRTIFQPAGIVLLVVIFAIIVVVSVFLFEFFSTLFLTYRE